MMQRIVKIVSLTLLLIVALEAFTQNGTTTNFLPGSFQQKSYNPAYNTPYKNVIGIPGVSNIQARANNNVISLNNAVYNMDDTVAYLDLHKIVSNMSNNNVIGVEAKLEVLGFGMQIKDRHYFTLNIDVQAEANVILQKRSAGFVLNGPGAYLDQTEDALSGNKIDVNSYISAALGYSVIVNKYLTLGFRPKVLFGLYNLYMKKSDVGLTIDDGTDPEVTPYTYYIQPNVEIYGSLGKQPEEGLVEIIRNFKFVMPSNPFGNLGAGLDVGATYRFSNKFMVGLSINDLGFIRWAADTRKLSSIHSKPYVFKGVEDLKNLVFNDSLNLANTFLTLKDSLLDYLSLQNEACDSYTRTLTPSFNLSGFLDVTPVDQIGCMWRYRGGDYKISTLTVAYTRQVSETFSVTVNNSIINSRFINLGAGILATVAGSLQFFLVVDKVNSINVLNMRTAGVQAGLTVALNKTRIGKKGFIETKKELPKDDAPSPYPEYMWSR
ncbi:hypothetical protein FACS1894201_02550 [Bacteroidia bacterium]|nr:hypothetical protein FACS1894201_02550 [Bacteroidia bacterium]